MYSKYLFPALGATLLALLVHYYWPKIETKTVVQTKIVTLNHTVTRIVQRPDGSRETTIDSTTNSTATAKNTSVQFKAPNWHVSAAAVKKLDSWTNAPVYQLAVERRILGPIYIGALLSTQREVGLSIGLEF